MVNHRNSFQILLLIVILMAFYRIGESQNIIIPVDIATQKANLFLEKLKIDKNIDITLKDTNPLKLIKDNKLIGYKYDLVPQGFIITSPFDLDNSIMAYSYENDFSVENEGFEISLTILEKINEVDQNSIKSNIINRSPAEEVGPLVSSLFGQVNCHDENDKIINVSNLFTPNHYAPGCVAISLATMLDYFEWPITGIGEHIDRDRAGLSKGDYKAEFDKVNYDWDNILDRYNYRNSTNEQRRALGLLAYHCAVALDMDFEYNGSSSNVNRIPSAGENYFRFYAKYASATSPIFWKTVDTNIVHGFPVVFAISAGSNAIGHSIVCDGVRIENGESTFHHLNMGWWGSSNGWYRVKTNFNAGGYNTINGGTINFFPIPEINDLNINQDSTVLTVYWRYSTILPPESFELQAKYDDGNWIAFSDTLTNDSLNISLDTFNKNIKFRIRAKFLGRYINDSWSNTMEFKKQTDSNEEISDNRSFEIFP
ncbi:MAG TPA: hypothetical protein ENK91_14750, partial [Bacteroidetes bacterium]|nr:hypothetical protein [Bacteroidota bacterium]